MAGHVEGQVNISPFRPIPFSLSSTSELKVFHMHGEPGHTGLLSLHFNDTCLNVWARNGIMVPNITATPTTTTTRTTTLGEGDGSSPYLVATSGGFIAASGQQDNAEWFFLAGRKAGCPSAPAASPQQVFVLTVYSYATEVLHSGVASQGISLTDRACRIYRAPLAGKEGVAYLNLIKADSRLQVYADTTTSPNVIPDLTGPGLTWPGFYSFPATSSVSQWYLVVCSQPQENVAGALLVVTTSPTLSIDSGAQLMLPQLLPGSRTLVHIKSKGVNTGGVVAVRFECPAESCHYDATTGVALYINSLTVPSLVSTTLVTASGQNFISATTDGVDWWMLAVVSPTIAKPVLGLTVIVDYAVTTLLGDTALMQVTCSQRYGYALFKFPPAGHGHNGVVRLEISSSALGPSNFSLSGSLLPGTIGPIAPLGVTTTQPLAVANPALRDGATWYLVLSVPCSLPIFNLRLNSVATQQILPGIGTDLLLPSILELGGKLLLRLHSSSSHVNGLLFFQRLSAPYAGLSLSASYGLWPTGRVRALDATAASSYVAADGAQSDTGVWYFLATLSAQAKEAAGAYSFLLKPTPTSYIATGSTTEYHLSFPLHTAALLLRVGKGPSNADLLNGVASLGYTLAASPISSLSLQISNCGEIPAIPATFTPSPPAGQALPPQESCSYWMILYLGAPPTTTTANATLTVFGYPAITITGNQTFSVPGAITTLPSYTMVGKLSLGSIGPARLPSASLVLKILPAAAVALQVFVLLDQIPQPALVNQVHDGEWVVPWDQSVQADSIWYVLFVYGGGAATSSSAIANVTVTATSTLEICNPVLTCSATGSCSDGFYYNPTDGMCDCLNTFSFVFQQPFCEDQDRLAFWWFLIGVSAAVWVVPLLVIYSYDFIVRWVRKKKEKSRQGEDSSLLAASIPAPTAAMDITLSNVSTKASSGDFHLHKISARFKPGRLYAIMGTSGAGKSTLLNVMLGKLSHTGKIYINGHEDKISRHRKNVGFVPQDDIMLMELSVKENISYSAALRLPRTTSIKERQRVVRAVLTSLRLKDVKHSQIGFPGSAQKHISGGQRKRTSIAMELVASPSVIFLDEPTSGLDSKTALELTRYLKTIAEAGYTVISVIHQPSPAVFALFDKVMFLAKQEYEVGEFRGVLKYFGRPGDAYRYITEESGKEKERGEGNQYDADYLMENLENFEPPQEEEEEEGGKKPKAPPAQGERPTLRKTPIFLVQLWWFFSRAVLQQKYNLRSFYLNNVLVAVGALLLGYSFRSSKYKGPVDDVDAMQCPAFILPQCLLPQEDDFTVQFLMTTMAVGLTAIAASLSEFGNERLVYWRESLAGASETAYFIGKNIANSLNVLVPPLIYTVIYYATTSSVMSALDMYWVLLGVQLVCVGVGYTLSIVLKQSLALVVGIVFVFVAVVLSGFNPTLVELKSDFGENAPIVTWWSFARWSIEALYVAEVTQYSDIYNINTGLRAWDFDASSLYRNVGILFAMGVGVRLIALATLKYWNATERAKLPLYKKLIIQLQFFCPAILRPLIGTVDGGKNTSMGIPSTRGSSNNVIKRGKTIFSLGHVSDAIKKRRRTNKTKEPPPINSQE